MLHVGIDDTDARTGGCTTWLVQRVLDAFPECALSGFPRLVRLNPNVPWKTRGNAAVAFSLDDAGALDAGTALERVRAVVARHARRDAGTSPGVVVTLARPPRAFYERAVTRVVPVADARATLAACDAASAALGDGRGLVGATAAVAWTPRDRTFELVAYRARERWGTPRVVDAGSVRAVQEGFPSTFGSYDLVEDEVVMVPASPCPVLWGIRGEDPGDLARAARVVRGEAPAGFTLFESNQATDEHLVDRALVDVRADACESVRVTARVTGKPVEHAGHAFARVAGEGAVLRLAAYAPTRSFRRVVAALREGDEVRACGAVKAGPDGALTLNVEKLEVRTLADAWVKRANPLCACGKRMKSAGRGAGYRCRACGAKAGEDAAERAQERRGLSAGWHEVPACARRHLAMPLSRTRTLAPPGGREPARGREGHEDARGREDPRDLVFPWQREPADGHGPPQP